MAFIAIILLSALKDRQATYMDDLKLREYVNMDFFLFGENPGLIPLTLWDYLTKKGQIRRFYSLMLLFFNRN